MTDETKNDGQYRKVLLTLAAMGTTLYLLHSVAPLLWFSTSCAPAVFDHGSLDWLVGFGTFLALGALAFAWVVASILALLKKARWADVGLHLLLMLYLFGAAIASHGLASLAINARMKTHVAALEPVTDAIHEFQKTQGVPPASLDALVPEYLPEVPTSGMCAERFPLEYRAGSTEKVEHAWWDVGPHNGTSGLHVHTYGDPDHALLVLTLKDGKVSSAYFERKPAQLESTTFDMTRWHEAPEDRGAMVEDLAANHVKVGEPLESMTMVIGQPNDVVEVTPAGRWSLEIPLWYDLIDPVYMLYNSDESYKDSSILEKRIGSWALYHLH